MRVGIRIDGKMGCLRMLMVHVLKFFWKRELIRRIKRALGSQIKVCLRQLFLVIGVKNLCVLRGFF
jgi:hypothetical protein